MANIAAINAVENEITAKVNQLRKAEEVAATIPSLRSDLFALQRALGILKGEKPDIIDSPRPPYRHAAIHSQPLGTPTVIVGSNTNETVDLFKSDASIPQLVYSVLKEAGKPQSADEIMAALLVRNRNLSKPSVMGGIYRSAKQGRVFKLVKPGIFGLLEWGESQ